MNPDDAALRDERGPIGSTVVVFIITVFALFGPYAFNLSLGVFNGLHLVLWAITWHIDSFGHGQFFVFDPMILYSNLPLSILRLAFANQIYRYYEDLTTRNRAILVGILSEMQIVFINVLVSILFGAGGRTIPGRFQIVGPFPLLLLVGLVFLKLAPRPISGPMWKELDESGN